MNARAACRLWPVIVALSLGARHAEPVRLGLLVPSGELGLAARRGAELAVETANREGGFRGRPFELVVRSVEGPWGSGSSKITALVFDESVWAILGPLHGRSAHLAEQVAAKGHVALVSPWASDPTLTQANVPWFFRCVPDDRQQATALVHEIFGVRRLDRVLAVVADSYDARVAADAFAAEAGSPHMVRWPLPETDQDLDSLLDRLEDEEIQGVVLFGPGSRTEALTRRLRARRMGLPVFAPLSSADLARRGSWRSDVQGLFVVAPDPWVTAEGQAFLRTFQAAYDQAPTAVSAYAYDGLMVIVEAVRQAGLDRQRIRDALADIDYGAAITGRIRFDAKGNRVADATEEAGVSDG
jgi:branched-chain amino acid transport system substrate-binding protein